MTTAAPTGRPSLIAVLPITAERTAQLTGIFREARSFGMIGAANAVVDIALFTVLHTVGVGPMSAKVVSGLVTIVISYYANRRWTWPHRPGRDDQRRQLLQFAAISGAGLALAEGCLAVSHYLLHLHGVLADNLSANVVGLALGMLWRFYASRRWVFTSAEPTDGRRTSTAVAGASSSDAAGARALRSTPAQRPVTARAATHARPVTEPLHLVGLDRLLDSEDAPVAQSR
jgi:putative flippase GtrA